MAETKVATRASLADAPSAGAMPVLARMPAELTPAQIDVIKNTVAKGASDEELQLFIMVCNRTGLDPFARQIYAIKRRTKDEDTQQWRDSMVFQIAIEGFRLIAERTGKYQGQHPTLFIDQAGNEKEVWLDSKPPRACKVTVLKSGYQPFTAVALWDEFVQKNRNGAVTKMWSDKPTIMIAKCAEAMALRKGFPQELSGLYAHEEMQHDDIVDEGTAPGSVTATRAHVVDREQQSATVNNAGDVVLTFGKFNGRTLASLSKAELEFAFINAWKDPARRATAAQRMGPGFVAAAEAEYSRKCEAETPAPAPLDPAMEVRPAGEPVLARPAAIAKLYAERAAGVDLSAEDLEELRLFELDHPELADSAKAE